MATARTRFTSNNFNVAALDASTHYLTNSSTLWAISRFLIGAADGPAIGPTGLRPASSYWIVEGSSDGVTGAMDGVDRLAGAFNPAKLVTGGNGAPHSWIVLRSPAGVVGGPIRYLFAWTNIFNASVSAAVTKDTFTGGNASNNPTAGTALGGLRPFSIVDAYFQPFLGNNSPKINYSCDANGYFDFVFLRSGATDYDARFNFIELVNTRVTDPNPWVTSWSSGFENTTTDQYTWSLIGNSWHQCSNIRPIAHNIDVMVRPGWPPDGSGGLQRFPLYFSWAYNRGNGAGVSNPLEWGIKGAAIDAFYGPTPAINYASPSSGDIDYISYGSGIWLPFGLLPS